MTEQLKFKGRDFFRLKPELLLQSCYFQIKSRSRSWGEELCPCLPWQPVLNSSGWGSLSRGERGPLVLQHGDPVHVRITWQLMHTLPLDFLTQQILAQGFTSEPAHRGCRGCCGIKPHTLRTTPESFLLQFSRHCFAEIVLLPTWEVISQ